MYLSGVKNPHVAADIAAGTIGLLLTPRSRYSLDHVAVWALDNGCFTDAYPGDDAYLALLDKLEPHRPRCLFVAAPDVLADAPATLALLPTMAPYIRDRGWPVALVGQDGMQHLPVPWQLVDWLFVGGSTAWKLDGALTLIAHARAHGKRIHVGRVNTGRRFHLFADLADTCDGTLLAYGNHTHRIHAWMARLPQQHIPSQ